MIFFIAFVALLVGSTAFAAWRGGAPERLGAGFYWIAWLVTLFVNPDGPSRWRNVEIGYLVVDVALLLALAWLALRANRIWPMPAATLQLIIVLGHVAKILDPRLLGSAYAIMSVFWPYLQLSILAIGTGLHWRRGLTREVAPSWSSFSRR